MFKVLVTIRGVEGSKDLCHCGQLENGCTINRIICVLRNVGTTFTLGFVIPKLIGEFNNNKNARSAP